MNIKEGNIYIMNNKILILIISIVIALLMLGCIPEPDNTPPDEVSNLSSAPGDQQITLTWTDPMVEDLDKIEISGELIYTVEVEDGVETVAIQNLHNTLDYTLTVKTVDTNGNKSEGVQISDTPNGTEQSPHIDLCQEIANNWVGVFLVYGDTQNFIDECSLVSNYATEMQMIQEVRPFVPDGHFYIGLNEYHTDNRYNDAKLIPLVVTEDINGETAIAKSKSHLRDVGLKEGNTILSINGNEVSYYINQLMELFPQSSEYESKEKAYRVLFSTIRGVANRDHYFEIPLFDGESPLDIEYRDFETGDIDTVTVSFESILDYQPTDVTDTSLSDYLSLQRYYDVPQDDVCTSDNEFATIKTINGEKWFIYHPMSFLYDTTTDYSVQQSLQCYIDYANDPDIDYFVLDLRDSVGGYVECVNIMLNNIGVDTNFDLYLETESYQNGSIYSGWPMTVTPDSVNGVPQVSTGDKPVYIWPNAIAGSACDIFLYSVTQANEPHIKIVGKPSAGRVQAITHTSYLDYDITFPFLAIYDEDDVQLEGRPIMPDYDFDVEAQDYVTPDEVFSKYVQFIEDNSL